MRFTDAEIEELVHTVGNLVLLSKGKNSSAANKEFANKKSTYLQPRVSDYPRSLETLGYESWTPNTVRESTKFAHRASLEQGHEFWDCWGSGRHRAGSVAA
ncbi:HNH endonuclease family protein [Homoserinimonas sp. A447]